MTIHRTRQGGPPSGAPETGRDIVQLGDVWVEYSGPVPSQADLDAYLAPPDPADADLTAEELAQIIIANPGRTITDADVAAKKQAR